METWQLTPAEFEATRDKIAKINARAEKRGFTGRIDVTGERVERTWTTPVGVVVTEVIYETTLTGEPPRYDGWTLLAALDWVEAGVIVRTAPGVESVDRSRLKPGKCDYCNVERDRRKSYVVSDGEEELQVGSTCLKDFLGWATLPAFLSPAEVSETVSSFCGTGERTFTVESVLAVAWAVVTTFGFVPSRQENCTVGVVGTILCPPNGKGSERTRQFVERMRPVVEQAAEMGATLRAWVLSEEFSGTSEYVQNLKTLCASSAVTWRELGFLVSAPQAMARAQERTLIRERERADAVNEWFGAVKERVTLRVKVRAVRFLESQWGATTVYTMVGDGGHAFRWFASRSALGEEPSEEYVTLVATIAKHDEYQGRKTTKLTRCVVQPAGR